MSQNDPFFVSVDPSGTTYRLYRRIPGGPDMCVAAGMPTRDLALEHLERYKVMIGWHPEPEPRDIALNEYPVVNDARMCVLDGTPYLDLTVDRDGEALRLVFDPADPDLMRDLGRALLSAADAADELDL